LTSEILGLELQVQSDHFEEFFAPELEKHGYAAVYKKKTAEVYTGTAYTTDGCATFFRRSRFTLVKKYEVGLLSLLLIRGQWSQQLLANL
jgi:CCR4-NOT transcription complex subunit 6